MSNEQSLDIETCLQLLREKTLQKKKINSENLDLDYIRLLPKDVGCRLMEHLEESVEYLEAKFSQGRTPWDHKARYRTTISDCAKCLNKFRINVVKVFGKWYSIPRQQAAYGDDGIIYRFSGANIPSKPWLKHLQLIRDVVNEVTGFNYNFVLINRYRNGSDHIGEHKDDEHELDKNTPIASLSLGQQRVFVLKHEDTRKKGPAKRNVPKIQIELEHGSLLLMNPPTNSFWYHSLPARKGAPGVRINLTFRKINL